MQTEKNKALSEDKIIGIINNFLHEEFEVELVKIVPSADLKSTLELDSLDYIDLGGCNGEKSSYQSRSCRLD